MTPVAPIEPKKSKFPQWLAAVPALVIVTIFASRAFVQTGQASRAISGDSASDAPKSLACVETYGVNLSNSEFYVPEGKQFVPRKTVEMSTVLNGMVKNNCEQRLKSVTIYMHVRANDGKEGDGSVMVSDLNPGEAKPFKKAWMGLVTSFEIRKIR